MSDSDPKYKYFENPHAYSSYEETPQECELCGEEQPGYEGPFYGEEDIEFVCEECLGSGALGDEDLTTNQGDMEALRQQLEARHPEASVHQIAQMVEERYAELAERTPKPVTWQDFVWPAHCGDFCQFVKEIGQADLGQLAQGGDAKAFLLAHLPPELREQTPEDLYDRLRPDSPQGRESGYHDTAAYLFRCLECGEPIILWDAS